MNNILYLKDVALPKKILGFSFAVLGLLMLLSLSIVFGAIFMVIGLNLISTEGAEISLKNNTYRNVKSLFGFHFGKWQPCPQFEYVSVFKTTENQTFRVVTAETTIESDVILLNLFYGNKHITAYKTQNKEDAFTVAKKLKSIFHIDILDATGEEKKWL